MKATLLTIGDELLIGQVIDTNSAWMAGELHQIGIKVERKVSVGDNLGDIAAAIDSAFATSKLILMTGGLGPTRDDVTKKALVQYFECGMRFSQETYDRIEAIFNKRNIQLTSAHREQCYIPEKAELLSNRMGTAPGMWLVKSEKVLVSMPGVPHEMKYIMKHGVLPRIEGMSSTVLLQKTIRTIGTSESTLAAQIEPVLEVSPVKIAYLPSIGQVRIRLSIEETRHGEGADQLDQAVVAVEKCLSSQIFGYDDITIEQVIGQMLRKESLTLATAESCTGGYLAHLITSVAGSSEYYQGSIIAYSNSLKSSLLNVRQSTLDQHGAVSEETVKEMVAGVLYVAQAQVAVAISGIAGPSGGSDERPVGTIWIAVGDANRTITRKHLFTKDRILNIKYTAVYAFDLLRKFLLAR
ncbi:MAG: competence/damage-inducible protein A [Saprospiraceae bacterium]|nr:competence/damage-inducible protein A [Saprospiraceae bacterium]